MLSKEQMLKLIQKQFGNESGTLVDSWSWLRFFPLYNIKWICVLGRGKNSPFKLWADQDLYVYTSIHAAEYIRGQTAVCWNHETRWMDSNSAQISKWKKMIEKLYTGLILPWLFLPFFTCKAFGPFLNSPKHSCV